MKNVNYINPNIDKFVPFYNSKEIEFWETNLQNKNEEFKNQQNLKEL